MARDVPAMRSLGKVLHPVGRDQVLVAASGPAGLGARVLGSDGREVGNVADVIGPVARPYLVVRTRVPPQHIAGWTVYGR